MLGDAVYRSVGTLTGAGPAFLAVGRWPYRQEAGGGSGSAVSASVLQGTRRGDTGLAIDSTIARARGWTVEIAEGEDGSARAIISGVDVVRGIDERGEAVSVA